MLRRSPPAKNALVGNGTLRPLRSLGVLIVFLVCWNYSISLRMLVGDFLLNQRYHQRAELMSSFKRQDYKKETKKAETVNLRSRLASDNASISSNQSQMVTERTEKERNFVGSNKTLLLDLSHDKLTPIALEFAKQNKTFILDETITEKLATAMPEFDTDGITRIHVVFSTECSKLQNLQSYALFHSAMEVRQPGIVTRIASGCSSKQAEQALKWHDEHIRSTMSDSFRLHLTPDFSSVIDNGKKVGKYMYFNKPFGLKHWLEHGDGMGIDPKTGKLLDEDIVVVLIDPDMILLRPFSTDFSNSHETIFATDEVMVTKVQHGKPFAQRYSLGARWKEFNLTEIAGSNSLAKQVEKQDAIDYYMVGPPYLATGKDMYAIAKKWVEFAPRVQKEFPDMLAEMYAYCIAAAHLNLPHTIVKSLMLTSIIQDNYGEAWRFVNEIPSNQVCNAASNPNHEGYPVPNVIHYSQYYRAGGFFFWKYHMKPDFFTCSSPMMEIPPPNLGAANYSLNVMWKDFKIFLTGEKVSLGDQITKGEAFMLCGIISHLDKAAEFYKGIHCRGEIFTSLNKTLNLANLLPTTQNNTLLEASATSSDKATQQGKLSRIYTVLLKAMAG